MIPEANPKAQYLALREEIEAAVARVLESGRYVLGNEVEAFEREFAQYLGVADVVGVANGTEALVLALEACGVGPGDDVATVSHTAVATVAAIVQTGAAPIFCDIDPRTFTLDPSQLERILTPRTKAIIPVHLYGQPADMDPILEVARARGLAVVEDCAQAHGALLGGRRVGSMGDFGCFSFYPTKNLGALGDGGAIATQDRSLAERLRQRRQYGWAQRYVSQVHGRNSRLDELQAAVLRVKLHHLDEDNSARHRLAQIYQRELADTPLGLPRERRSSRHVYHLFVARSTHRDELLAHLAARRVGVAVHYPLPVHRQPAYYQAGVCLSHTEQAANEVISLPMYPQLSLEDQAIVIRAVKEFRP